MLKNLLSNIMTQNGLTRTGIEGLNLYRMDTPYPKKSGLISQSVCFVVQGHKVLYLGNKRIAYDEHRYLISSTNMPIDHELKEATPEQPYLGIVLDIDLSIMNVLIQEMEQLTIWPNNPTTDILITDADFDGELEGSLARLINASQDPIKAKVLGNTLLRETYFHILQGPLGYVFRNCVANHARAHKIVSTIQHLEQNFKKSIDINQLAQYAAMSPASLFNKFKAATSLSPIQFVKKLRLHYAHNLLLAGEAAGEAAFNSGYSSQSQFSREFKRQFGYTPSHLREKNNFQDMN